MPIRIVSRSNKGRVRLFSGVEALRTYRPHFALNVSAVSEVGIAAPSSCARSSAGRIEPSEQSHHRGGTDCADGEHEKLLDRIFRVDDVRSQARVGEKIGAELDRRHGCRRPHTSHRTKSFKAGCHSISSYEASASPIFRPVDTMTMLIVESAIKSANITRTNWKFF